MSSANTTQAADYRLRGDIGCFVWYAPNVISALVAVFGLAGYGFYRSVEWRAEMPELFTEDT